MASPAALGTSCTGTGGGDGADDTERRAFHVHRVEWKLDGDDRLREREGEGSAERMSRHLADHLAFFPLVCERIEALGGLSTEGLFRIP